MWYCSIFWFPAVEYLTRMFYDKLSPSGLVLEFMMMSHFDTKQKSKSFTLCNCVWSRWVYVIVWFTLTLTFWYSKLKKALFSVCCCPRPFEPLSFALIDNFPGGGPLGSLPQVASLLWPFFKIYLPISYLSCRVTSIANKRHSVSDHVFDLIFFCKVLHSRQSSSIEAIFSESGRREWWWLWCF